MKVLIISAAFPPLRGGESDHMLHLANRLAGLGLDVSVLTVKGSEASASFPFKVYPIMGDWSWTELPKLMRFLVRNAPDAILLKYSGWLYNEHPMITFAPTISKRLLPRTRFVSQFGYAGGAHTKTFAIRVVRKIMRILSGHDKVDVAFGTLLRDSDSVIALGEDYASMLFNCLPEIKPKTMVIPPPPILHIVGEEKGESRRRGREMLGLGQDDFVLAYFGVLYRSKGLETLLEAFQKVALQRKNVKLALIGGQSSVQDGRAYFEEICALARKLGVDDRIVAKEYEWDSTDGSYYLRSADVCVLPFDDGVSLIRSSVAGASAHGLPIITTQGKTLETPFIHGRTVLLCPPKNPQLLAEAIESTIDSAELRRNLGEGSMELGREWFSWDKAIRKTVEAFEGKDSAAPEPGLRAVGSHAVK